MISSQQNNIEHGKKWHEQHPFILSDGRGISKKLVDELCEIIARDASDNYFLNMITLKIEHDDGAHSDDDKGQMQTIPHADAFAMRKIMEDALEIMQDPICGDEEHEAEGKVANKKLEQLLNNNQLSALDIEKEMYKTHPYMMGAWDQGKADYLWGVLNEWLCVPPIEAKENTLYWFSDDDCPVCEYMRSVEDGWISPTISGLQGAMKEADKK